MVDAAATWRATPYAIALAVTILWSSSYVLIKWGLEWVPPLYFASLRYVLAFAVIAVADIALPRNRGSGKVGGRAAKRTLVLAGICGYTIAQGFQYVGLFFLPAVATSLLLTFNPIFVLVIGAALLNEGAGSREIGGLLLALAGGLVFFYERVAWQGQWFGVVITLVSGIGWALYVVMVRGLQREVSVDPLRMTNITMGIGAAGLVVLTALSGEYAPLTLQDVFLVAWLATVNTALAFFLWNKALASVPAFHLTVFQNIMLVEIALFSVAFLGESVTPLMTLGMALVLLGVFFVQLRGVHVRER